MNEKLIVVDINDQQVGWLDKVSVHKYGLLHRAFSVFIFNSEGELLLQQRADHKYHSGGLWTNTCCSHPRDGEDTRLAVSRRLKEEMNLECETHFTFSFIYKALFENGLTEHEYDHVYWGVCDDVPEPDISEVKSWKYVLLHQLEKDIQQSPDQYTEWLKICLPRMLDYYQQLIEFGNKQIV